MITKYEHQKSMKPKKIKVRDNCKEYHIENRKKVLPVMNFSQLERERQRRQENITIIEKSCKYTVPKQHGSARRPTKEMQSFGALVHPCCSSIV